LELWSFGALELWSFGALEPLDVFGAFGRTSASHSILRKTETLAVVERPFLIKVIVRNILDDLLVKDRVVECVRVEDRCGWRA